jgi:hypothetical protein
MPETPLQFAIGQGAKRQSLGSIHMLRLTDYAGRLQILLCAGRDFSDGVHELTSAERTAHRGPKVFCSLA